MTAAIFLFIATEEYNPYAEQGSAICNQRHPKGSPDMVHLPTQTPHPPPAQLTSLSTEDLLKRTLRLVEGERRVSVAILHHLAEIDRRRAYAKLGYGSLWDYALKELKYSESAAYKRISAMRALRVHPELEEKIEAGKLSVSAVSQVQTFLRTEREQALRTYSPSEKANLYQRCENLSSREVTRVLSAISPLAHRVQMERSVAENRTEIRFIVERSLLSKIHRVRDLSASRLKNPHSYAELMDLMSEVTLKEIDPLRKVSKTAPAKDLTSSLAKPDKTVALITCKVNSQSPHDSSSDPSTPQASTTPPRPNSSRHIPSALRTEIWKQYEGRCAYISPETGRRCERTFGLEIEHCEPAALGGSSIDPKNLKLLCRTHNQWQAIQAYGLPKMEKYLNRNTGASNESCEPVAPPKAPAPPKLPI